MSQKNTLESSTSAAYQILEKPAPLLLWLFPMALIALLVSGLVWSWLATINIVTPVIGTLIPEAKVKEVDATTGGIIQEIHVSNGSVVSAGDPLVSFLNVEVAANQQQNREDLNSSQWTIWRLETLLERTALPPEQWESLPKATYPSDIQKAVDQAQSLEKQWQAFLAQMNQAADEVEAATRAITRSEAEITRLEASVPFLEDSLTRATRLRELGSASTKDLEDARQALTDKLEAIQVETRRREEAVASLAVKQHARDSIQQNFEQETTLELATSRGEYGRLEQEIVKGEQSLTQSVVRSPIDGTVTELVEVTLGGQVNSGDVMMKIVPSNNWLEMVAKVPTTEIGFIEIGQPVRVKIDTFEFTKYGYIEGEIAKIAANAVKDEESGAFVYSTTVRLDENQMLIGERNVRLSAGMTGSVDIQTGNRRLAEYIIEPFLRYRDQALRER